MYIILAIVMLGILILIHEAGHYFMGKRAGIRVLEFAIGFGPKLVTWRRNGTNFSLRLLPLGGFVQFQGEDEEDSDPASFNNASVWKRFRTIFAGPATNLLFAFLLAIVVMMGFGNNVAAIHSFSEGSLAEECGLQEGDIIRQINGRDVTFAGEARPMILATEGQYADITIERNGVLETFCVEKTLIDGDLVLGVTLAGVNERVGFLDAIKLGWRWNVYVVESMVDMIGQVFSGQQALGDAFAGPVGTIGIIAESAQSGLDVILLLAAMISLNLGLINLLPIPSLDGCRLLILLIEAVRRKPIDREKEGMIHLIGLGLFMILFLVLTYNDILRLF